MGAHQVPLHEEVQALLFHILGTVGVLLGHHIHMALDHDGGRMLISRRRGFPDDHVVELVPTELQPMGFGKIHQIVADGPGVVGAVGDGAQLLKEAEDGFRLQAG